MNEPKTYDEERRRYPRIQAPILYRAARLFGPRRKVSNISLAGVRIFSDEPLKKGKRIEIELFLSEEKSVVAVARVIWSESLPSGAEAAYDVGLEFVDLPPGALEELKSIVEQHAPPE